MAWIVNVDGLNFGDIIPLLLNNCHIKTAIGDFSPTYQKREELILKMAKKVFRDLKRGHIAEHYLIGKGVAECLHSLGRVLTYIEFSQEEFNIFPISKKEIQDFILNCDLMDLKGLDHDKSPH